jgi:release factor glutamine methyltransferase
VSGLPPPGGPRPASPDAERRTRRRDSGSVGEALGAATDALAAAEVGSPRLDAELLLAEATGRDRAALIADADAAVEPAAARRFGEMVRRRVRREPVAYILGRRGFRRLELASDARALIPRPESEHLVEAALELDPATVLDVGTGSGAIALAIADELPQARVTATDTSASALELAAENATRLGLADRVTLVAGALPPGGGAFDLLVANLPYVSESDGRRLEPEIVRYEPPEALVAGPTGLEAIEWLIGAVSAGAVEVEAIALEVGEGQAPLAADLVREAGYRVELRPDLAGIERVVLGRRVGR